MPPAPQEVRTYFITAVTASRRRLFQVEQNATLFLKVLEEQRIKNRLQLHAFVVMPDHVHLLLTPAPDISLEKVMQFIKGVFSFRLKSKLGVWERSYDSRRIIDIHDYTTHTTYIHHNPICTRLASVPELYRFSSANPIHVQDPCPVHFTRHILD
jgi:putative transposase